MNHADVRRQLSEYLEGDLSEREEERVRAHLEACASAAPSCACSAAWSASCASSGAVEPPHDLADAVVTRLRAGEAGGRGRASAPFSSGYPRAGWCPSWPLRASPRSPCSRASTGRASRPPRCAICRSPPDRWPRGARAGPPAGPGRAVQTASLGEQGSTRARSRPIASCLEGAPRGAATAEACAAWYSWFVAMALEDSRGFVHEVEHLPRGPRPVAAQRGPVRPAVGLRPLVGQQLRTSRDPQAASIAKQFEYGAGVRQVDWTGH